MLNATRLTPPINTTQPISSTMQPDIETGQRSPVPRAALHQSARPAQLTGIPARAGQAEGFTGNDGSSFMIGGATALVVAGIFVSQTTENQDGDYAIGTSMMTASFCAIGLGMVALGLRDRIAFGRQAARADQIATPPATPTAVALPMA